MIPTDNGYCLLVVARTLRIKCLFMFPTIQTFNVFVYSERLQNAVFDLFGTLNLISYLSGTIRRRFDSFSFWLATESADDDGLNEMSKVSLLMQQSLLELSIDTYSRCH